MQHARQHRNKSPLALIGNELEQRAVGIAEIDAGSRALCTEALDGPGVDRDAAALEMADGVGDRPVPLEAEIAVAGLDRKPRGVKSRPVQIELHRAEAV